MTAYGGCVVGSAFDRGAGFVVTTTTSSAVSAAGMGRSSFVDHMPRCGSPTTGPGRFYDSDRVGQASESTVCVQSMKSHERAEAMYTMPIMMNSAVQPD